MEFLVKKEIDFSISLNGISLLLIIVYISLNIYGPFLKLLSTNIYQYDTLIIPILRDGSLFSLLILNFLNVNRQNISRKTFIIITCIMLFSVIYSFQFILGNKFIEGAYFLRIYLVLFFSFFLFKNHLTYLYNNLLSYIIYLNLLTFCFSIVIYIVSLNDNSFFFELLGIGNNGVGMAPAWRLSGANLIRLGFPLGGPNLMGLYCAVNIFFYFTLRDSFQYPKFKRVIWFLVTINAVCLILTFSRSSILFVLTSFLFISIDNFRRVLNFLFFSFISILVLGIFFIILNGIFDDILLKWLELNLTFDDPSIQGHLDIFSFFSEIDRWGINGYSKGTVGPRAEQFTSNFINVENSLLIIFFEMGIPLGILFYFILFYSLTNTKTSKYNSAIIFSIFINFQLLPNVFEIEILIYLILLSQMISFDQEKQFYL